jgi:glutamate dehydrogenase
MSSDTALQKKAFLEQISIELQQLLEPKKAETAKQFVQQCFRRVPVEDMARYAPSVFASMVRRQLAFIDRRKPGELLIRVFNPSAENAGWESSHTIVEMVNDDMPFLVDTAALTVSEMGLGIHLIVHPVIRISRDKSGKLLRVEPKKTRKGKGESLIQLQVDRTTNPEDLAKIKNALESAFADVRKSVSDWKAMEARVTEAADLMPEWAPGVKKEWMSECQDFVRWLLDDHFVLLGVRDYRVTHEKKTEVLQVVEGSGLGVLREDGETRASRPIDSLSDVVRKLSQKRPLLITKTNTRSTVHRAGYMDYIGVLQIDESGKTVGERRFLGLFTSTAYNEKAMDTPMVRVRALNIMKRSDLVEGSHAWKTMLNILETLPRDELLQATSRQLREIAEGVLNLQERKLVRLFIRRERYGRFYSCLVYLPREQFNTENREKIQRILKRALKGTRLDYNVKVSESRLARLQVLVRPRPGVEVDFDTAALEKKIIAAVRSWDDELRDILVEKHGEEDGLRAFARFGKAFPEAYKEDVSPWVAAFDVSNASAVDRGEPMRMSLYRPRKPRGGIIRFKLFRKDRPLPLSDILPILENLALHIVNERPYELEFSGEERLWVQDFDMVPAIDRKLDLDVVRDLFEEAFTRVANGEADNDGFNRLVIAAQMHWRQVKILRAYCKYLLQTNSPFSASYMAETLTRHPGIARVLVELFEASFDPRRDKESDFRRDLGKTRLTGSLEILFAAKLEGDPVLHDYIDELVAARGKDRSEQVSAANRLFKRALESVASLDEDRILFAFYEVIGATLRTNFYQKDSEGRVKDYVSFKINSQALPELPQPRPYREIWVYSPRFEGVHLRGGKIARGGLRWSDRREDFRTEVLGLMKAQNVKNTMIVPVGAKGGFVLKALPAGASRDVIQEEGVRSYKSFINGLLDITDNLDKEKTIPPNDVIRLDEDDPYLVVAADKGTATFSDTANGVAAEHGFWLGDAFASGGSVGYDHKAMGITAKGAWESVKRHFREMGRDTQREAFSVVGIGDMAGDVFGNGMLLSRHIRLQAAFNHLHIFLDPNPDEKISFAERRRLFRMPRSAWTDYKPQLISRGGGVFSRQAKTIPISPEVRDWLGIEHEELTPNALIRELLKAPVDLLWNGGIGTYVKANSESHADVGDLANNSLRVNGEDLRCRVVGEGGNLGMTQLGRIEFARAGGRVNTDFIDNSAGVDTSDHEVNIKILLNLAVQEGDLETEERKNLLASMSDEVSEHVLRSNYLQTQALSMMESFSVQRLGSMRHFIDVLEDQGALNRDLEFLPDDDELTERREREQGLCRPELSVLLSYSKITLYQQLLASDVPEDKWLSDEAVNYFPTPLRERFGTLVSRHRLKREIIATQVTNSLVNRMGASFVLRMQEDTDASPGEVARAYTIARELFEARDFWSRVERLDNKVDSQLQMKAMLAMWTLMRQTTRWLLNLPDRRLDIRAMVDRLSPGLKSLEKTVRGSLQADELEQFAVRQQPYIDGGFPKALAARVVLLDHLFPSLDVVETAARKKTSAQSVAEAFYGLGERLEINWLRRQVEMLDVAGEWHAMSRANLRDELFTQHNRLVESVLKQSGGKKDPVATWFGRHQAAIEKVSYMVSRMRSQGDMDYATLSVAVRALGRLADQAG